MERINRPATFLDHALSDLGGRRIRHLLERLDEVVPWKRLAAPIRALPEYQPNPRGGRPAWPAETMLKCLMLAKWFNLSDPALEEQLLDRLSFRRFVGLSFEDATPDETSFVNFRDRLREARLDEKLFQAVVKYLTRHGVLVREGTIVDATIIEQSTGRPRQDGTSTRDEDASFTRKHGRTYHGYKGHVAVDRSGIVTDYRFTTAREHDSRRFDELTRRERTAVLGDTAYDDRTRRARLQRRGVIDGILYKRVRGQGALYDWQRRWNRVMSSVRAKAEHALAMVKHRLDFKRCRYRGLRRNGMDFALTVMAANLRRGASMLAARDRASPYAA